MKVLLARHGESHSNAAESVTLPEEQGDRLTERGIEQAHALGRSLRGADIDELISSPMGRARETAAAIGEQLGLEPEINPLIHELREGPDFGGLSAEEQKLRRWSEWMSDHGDDPDYSEGGESFNEVRGRVLRFQAELVERDPAKLPLYVSHGLFLRFFLIETLMGEEFGPGQVKRLWNMRTSNCGVCVFEHGESYHPADPERPDWVCSTWMARPWDPP